MLVFHDGHQLAGAALFLQQVDLLGLGVARAVAAGAGLYEELIFRLLGLGGFAVAIRTSPLWPVRSSVVRFLRNRMRQNTQAATGYKRH